MLAFTQVIHRRPGWYRGDLHAHTTHSDGMLSPSELIDLAREQGLDFLAITDHNTIDAFNDLKDAGAVAMVPGLEVTLDIGHFNVFGANTWQPWMNGICDRPSLPNLADLDLTLNELMAQISAGGFLNSINHPLLKPWAWEDPGTALDHLHCLEIWNDPSWPENQQANPEALALWTQWLNAGYRITAIGGSDFHRPQPPPGQAKAPERLGHPCTCVYVDSLSGESVLDALRQRRAYITAGPEVSFHARAEAGTFGIGQAAGRLSGELRLTGKVEAVEAPLQARIIKNGEIVAAAGQRGEGFQLEYRDRLEMDQNAWYRFEVVGENGATEAVTNPIFVGEAPKRIGKTYGDFVDLNP